MKELVAIAETFGVSEPVFIVSIDISGDLDFRVKDPYYPPKTDQDPVVCAVANTYNEVLDKPGRRFVKQTATDEVYNYIVRIVKEMYLKGSPLKNPKQSKLYKWLSESDPVYNNSSYAEGFIALYRYICSRCIDGSQSMQTNPHVINVIAILELMREKYER